MAMKTRSKKKAAAKKTTKKQPKATAAKKKTVAKTENVEEKKKVVEQARQEKKPEARKKDAKELEEEITDLNILKHPLVTEKAVNMIEAENKLTFVVDTSATKPLVRKAVEGLYKVKVRGVNIVRDMKARKRAIVTLDKAFKAADVATKLGVI